MFGRAAITLGIGPHSSLLVVFCMLDVGHTVNEINEVWQQTSGTQLVRM